MFLRDENHRKQKYRPESGWAFQCCTYGWLHSLCLPRYHTEVYEHQSLPQQRDQSLNLKSNETTKNIFNVRNINYIKKPANRQFLILRLKTNLTNNERNFPVKLLKINIIPFQNVFILEMYSNSSYLEMTRKYFQGLHEVLTNFHFEVIKRM